MEQKKISKTYRFEKEVIEHAETNAFIPSFALWACDRYRKEFLDLPTKVKKLEEACKTVEQLKAEIETLKKGQRPVKFLKDHEKRWIRAQAKRRIERSTFEGVYKAFTNEFGRKEISRQQFRKLVEEYGGPDQ